MPSGHEYGTGNGQGWRRIPQGGVLAHKGRDSSVQTARMSVEKKRQRDPTSIRVLRRQRTAHAPPPAAPGRRPRGARIERVTTYERRSDRRDQCSRRQRMPLRCVDGSGASIEATTSMTVEEWTKLRRRSRTERDLSMPCCAAAAIPKTSSCGTRFFAHKAGAHCSCKPETEVHRTMKASAVEVARQSGWEAHSEAGGAAPEGDRWTADVLCRKGTETVAIEVQWSAQTNEETWRRQDRYARSGITGIWLLRQPGFPVSPKLPATCIGGSLEEGLTVLIPGPGRYTAADRKRDGRWEQVLRPEVFLAGVFEGRFKFGLPDEARISFSIETGVLDCWRCGHATRKRHSGSAFGKYQNPWGQTAKPSSV